MFGTSLFGGNSCYGEVIDISHIPDTSLPHREGLRYLLEQSIKVGEGLPAICNAHAIPENRALEKAKWFPDLSLEAAKKLLEDERYFQKPENRDRYPGFKWF